MEQVLRTVSALNELGFTGQALTFNVASCLDYFIELFLAGWQGLPCMKPSPNHMTYVARLCKP
jgi:hypothetical protein